MFSYEQWIAFNTDTLGLDTVWKRMGVWAVVFSLAVYAVKPRVLFKEDGSMKMWKAMSHPEDAEAVDVPFPIPAVLAGILLGAL